MTRAACGQWGVGRKSAAHSVFFEAAPVDDPYYQGEVRADGKFVHAMYVWRTKTPQESQGPWDFFRLIDTIPPGHAFKPLAESGCPLAKS